MKKLFSDVTAETTATTGTGSVTLDQMPGYARFADRYANNDRVYYSIRNGANWEIGKGTYTASNILARTTILGTLAAGVWTSGGSALTLAGSSVVRAVVPEHLFTALEKLELSLIAAPQTLVEGYSYGVQANSLTLTLPAAPTANDRIQIVQAAASITGTIIDPNGEKINGTVGNMTIDVDEFSLSLVYISAAYGWKVTA